MKDQEDKKDVGGKGKIEAKVLENGRPTWNLAVTQSHKGEGQSQEKYEPKQIKRKANKLAQVRTAQFLATQTKPATTSVASPSIRIFFMRPRETRVLPGQNPIKIGPFA